MTEPDQALDHALQEAVQLHTNGHVDEAIDRYRALLDDHPDHPDLWHLLGVAAHQKDDNGLAVQLISTAISLRYDVADYHSNLGMAYRGLSQTSDAESCFRQAIGIDPRHTKALSNLASTLRHVGEFAAALDYARQAVTTNQADPEALNNLGNAEKDAGLVTDSVASYRRAIDLAPDFALAHWNLALALLSSGDLDEGFREMGWRWQWRQFPGRRRHTGRPEWDGGALDGKTLLLYPEQGFGDTLHLLRFARAANSKGGRVILELPPALVPLVENSGLADEVVPADSAAPDFDLQAPLMDVPALCGLRGHELFGPSPYLSLSGELAARWRDQLARHGGLKVGLNWSGNPESPVENFRRLPVNQVADLGNLDGITWFSLQKGKAPAPSLPDTFPLVDTGPAPLAETAGLIEVLDLVITSDTAVGHLAGALGKPVWVLLHHAPDWKWGLEAATPWYPTAQLFRQTTPGDWGPVFQAVRAQLETRSAAAGPQ